MNFDENRHAKNVMSTGVDDYTALSEAIMTVAQEIYLLRIFLGERLPIFPHDGTGTPVIAADQPRWVE